MMIGYKVLATASKPPQTIKEPKAEEPTTETKPQEPAEAPAEHLETD